MRQGMNRRKVVIVTGSTSGIGLGIARTFASNGYDIGLNGFGSQDDIQKIEGDLRENSGARVFYSNADMSKPDEIERYVHDAKEALVPSTYWLTMPEFSMFHVLKISQLINGIWC